MSAPRNRSVENRFYCAPPMRKQIQEQQQPPPRQSKLNRAAKPKPAPPSTAAAEKGVVESDDNCSSSSANTASFSSPVGPSCNLDRFLEHTTPVVPAQYLSKSLHIIMGAITYDMEVTSSIPPAKMFKAFVLDGDTLIPKVLPQSIKSVETLQGDGGAGTIKLTTFGEGSKHKCVKHKVDALDKENFTYSYSIIEGEALDGFESISYHIKIVASPDGGSICKNRSIYCPKGDNKVTEEEIKSGKEKASSIFKAVESYLLANPDC